MEPDTIEAALEKIRAMQESSKAQQNTMPPPLDEKQLAHKKRQWLDQVINLKTHHPQLRALEDTVYDYCMAFVKNPASGQRLIIFGENGTGKSHTAKRIYRWADRHKNDFTWVNRRGDTDLESRPPRCDFRNWRFLINELKSGFGRDFKKGQWGSYEQIFTDACNVELLVLDDIGTDNDPNKFGVEQLYMLLEAREKQWTVITTNIAPENWEDRFERRIASRMLRNSIHVPLTEVQDYNTI